MRPNATPTRADELRAEALHRAVTSPALTNYPAIFEGFMEKGIPEAEIKPRENVFTFNAWLALGRHVRRGEHGVQVLTWIQTHTKELDEKTGQPKTFRRPKTTTVFHISQTDPNEPRP